jgi:hypothetical protein
MAQTVSEVLTAATDSVTLINDVNTNGSDSDYVQEHLLTMLIQMVAILIMFKKEQLKLK